MYRPLSPHLFIYKPQWTSTFSVMHRITGILLSLGLVFLVILFKFSTLHITHYSIYYLSFFINTWFSWLFIGALIILIYSFFYHLSNGLRHLVWDLSNNHVYLQKNNISTSAMLILILTILLGTLFILFFSFV